MRVLRWHSVHRDTVPIQESGRSAFELLSKLSWQPSQRQRAAVLVKLDLVAQQVRLEADRHPFGPDGDAPEFVGGLLVWKDARGRRFQAGYNDSIVVMMALCSIGVNKPNDGVSPI